jgi:dTDP-glucose 4,6-dehydratase
VAPHCGVFPSTCIETYGIVLDECFELGLPCIVSDLGALPLRAGAAGLVTAAGDAASLATALQRLCSEPALWPQLAAAKAKLDAARASWRSSDGTWPSYVRFHHVSTDEVYGSLSPSEPPFTEQTPYAPSSPYAASKAASDHLVGAYHHTYGLPTTISNCSNNYGPYQFPEKVVPFFTTLALDDKPLPLYASTDHKREWLHVLDHCRAVEQIVLHGRDGETYNVGSGREATIDEIADLVLDTLGKPSSLKTIVPDRPGHDRRYLLDATKLRRELRWAPEVEFDVGLPATVEWYAANRAWWEPLLDRAPVVETAWSAGPASAR